MEPSWLLSQFRSKVVRDLVWSVASPNMLRRHFYDNDHEILGLEDSVGQRLVNTSMAWLRQLDDPSNNELVSFLRDPRRKAKRLGFYMSALLEFFIERCPSLRTQKLVCGQQIVRLGHVIGSLKFVFVCAPTDEVVRRALHIDPCSVTPGRPALCHWEASIKFFVHVEESLYIGPFLHETLCARVETCARKLSLSSEVAIRRWASRELVGDTDPHRVRRLAAACALRGYLFYRVGAPKPQLARHLSPSHGCGFWARSVDEIDVASIDIRASHWAILPKGHWLSPCRAELSGDGRFLIAAAEEAGVDEPCECQELSAMQVHLETLSFRCPGTPIMLAGLACYGQVLVETCRGFVLPANWKPLNRSIRRARDAPRSFPDPPHPSVAGSRGDSEEAEIHDSTGGVIAISLTEVDAGEVPATSAREIVERLDGRRLPHERRGRKLRDAAVLRDRASALLVATATPEQSVAELAIACCRELIVSDNTPRPVATRLGMSLLEAAASSSPCRAADEFFVDAATGRLRGGVAFELGLRCCELFAVDKSRLSSRQYAADSLRDALRLADDARLKLATKLVLARGRSNSLSSSELGLAAKRLTGAGAIDLAGQLVRRGPRQHDDKDELDGPAAYALIQECSRLGHVTKAKKFERAWFGETLRSTHYCACNMPAVWLKSDALQIESGLVRLGRSVSVRLATTCNVDTDPSGVVGLDVEWPHDDRQAPPSLLQLASTDHSVVVYDLAAMSNRKELARLLNTRTSVVLGFGIDADLEKLRTGYPDDFADLEVSRCEMQTNKSMSLSALCQLALGAGLCKRYQCSNWRARPLSVEQLHYAALDAFALLAIASVAQVELPQVPPLPGVSYALGEPPVDAVVVKSLALCSCRQLWRRVVAVLPSDARLDVEKMAVAMDCETFNCFRFATTTELFSRFGAQKGMLGPLGARAPVVFHAGLKGRKVATGSGRPEMWAVFCADDSFVPLSPRSRVDPERVLFADIVVSAESVVS